MSTPPEKKNRGQVVGIDLGTTFSAIAYIDAYGKPQIIPNAESERITPSVILFDGQEAIVGTIAQQNAVAEPEKIVDFVKREMGKTKAQFHREFGGKQYSAEELSALIVKKLKKDAEKYLREPVTDAVITVPAYFNDAERTATIRAGQIAGLNVLQVLNEPTAAALAYGLDKRDTPQTVFVFDLGGGTFDVTIIRIERENIRMIATQGDHRLGGKDWDDVILHLLAEEFESQHQENPLLDLESYQDLQIRATQAKVQLSSRHSTTIVHSHHGKSIRVQLTREELESRCRHLVERCKAICEIVMEQAQLNWRDLDCILLAGGMSRMPSVRRMLLDLVPDVPLNEDLNPDEAIAFGAAMQAMLMVLKAEPASSPDGAARISPIIRVRFSDSAGELISVTNAATHTLGVVLWDADSSQEYVYPIIAKSTPLPATGTHLFGLVRSGMDKVRARLVEGESSLPSDCTELGTCDVLLPPGLAKGTEVALRYSYDESQVLEVVVEVAKRQGRVELNRNAGMTESESALAIADLETISVS